ncbi:uncharacterized protein [Aegilops tauschii subsp. strangulata]|uniref:F-box domain-containing protein n=2 Tax=Aegilops tauschii TaxID=37682 RepID=A0A453SQF5_AEGTS|nr:uncharacterized protein LOC109778618 [Aegilops tauschii subsp. strangulata]
MGPPPLKLNIGRDGDRISALHDDLLLGILERLDLRDAVRAGALSARWRHLPYRLSRLHLNAGHFHRATLLEGMGAFKDAACRLLSVCPPPAAGKSPRVIETLALTFCVSAPHLSFIGRAVEDVVSRGHTKCFQFDICSRCKDGTRRTTQLLTELGKQFMSFSSAYPVAFGWLTFLTLEDLAFGDSDVADLIRGCDKLKDLKLRSCRLVDRHSALKIDTPHAGLENLWFISFRCALIELISVPKLRIFWCWSRKNPPVRCGYVPELYKVELGSRAKASQVPFALSECFSRSATNLSKLYLNFGSQMIWIKPEHPKELTSIFNNLTSLALFNIFSECNLSWTLFILEVAPALQKFRLSRTQHPCAKVSEDNPEKTKIVWEPSKDLKHLNLKLFIMFGFEDEDKVTNYIRLVMERAVGLKRIELHGRSPCNGCDAIDLESLRRSQADEASRHRIKEQLRHGSSSSVEIVIC